MLTIYTLYNVM